MNQVYLVGNAGADAEVKSVNGKTLTKLRLATTERYKSGGEDKKETTWHAITCWGDTGEAASQIKKGDRVIVTGKISVREYEKDGEKRKSHEIVAFNVAKLVDTRAGVDKAAAFDDIPFAP